MVCEASGPVLWRLAMITVRWKTFRNGRVFHVMSAFRFWVLVCMCVRLFVFACSSAAAAATVSGRLGMISGFRGVLYYRMGFPLSLWAMTVCFACFRMLSDFDPNFMPFFLLVVT